MGGCFPNGISFLFSCIWRRILNIVFDLAGVVFTWDPKKLIASVFEDRISQEKVMSEIYGHKDWVELDRGTIEINDAIKRSSKRTNLPISKINELMQKIPNELKPIDETINLIKIVKQKGNKLFVLSNMHKAAIEFIEENNSFWNLFDGMVISCRVQMVKPEVEIYEYLLNEYKLKAEETIFIDDTEINLDAAGKLGIQTIKFKNASQCEYELEALKCI